MVVGVVQDARYRGINDLRYDLYLPEAQIPGMRVKHLMVRTMVDPVSLTGPIRAEARRLDATALVENAAVMSSFVEHATAPWRFSALDDWPPRADGADACRRSVCSRR